MSGRSAEALRSEALGLYTGLKLRHIPLRIIHDELISPGWLRGLEAIVVTTAAWLTDARHKLWRRGCARADGSLCSTVRQPIPRVFARCRAR
jgi:hypothetical protein